LARNGTTQASSSGLSYFLRYIAINPIEIKAELNQARDLIQQLKEIPYLAGHLDIEV